MNKKQLGRTVYGVLVGLSSFLVLLGLHREFYHLLHRYSIPELVISGLAGWLNLSWYEIAYVVGSGLKNAFVFSLIPLVGGITGFLSALCVMINVPWKKWIIIIHIGLSILLSFLSICVLAWRFVRGMEDSWRFMTSICFFLFYLSWAIYFYKNRKFLYFQS